ncbi:unnamed protein product [Cuscuta epithymum]|uniref:23 kDa jasmonate-induced protein-like n=1 Tax=Cuscuta epithymum TaxID=186058 RepID=A0AAV0EU13_9ASTE|nr:unnamed protein product [Cuscuta epithymum]CAH9115943.1 unnamed protein product [Cuscuta epithymum]CAH9126722.1 unnamed protein product [Cuscuta epithymum]
MATNVFGTPVTDATVRLVYPNLRPEEITATLRAQVALRDMNANNRADNASTYVHNLKDAYGTGTTTLVTFFNATGGDLSFVSYHSWEGSVWRYPVPHLVQNGQWGAFLHVRDRLMGPSKAALIFSGFNHAGVACDWLLAWNTPRRHFQNRVYTEIRALRGFNSVNWNTIDNAMERNLNNHTTTWNGCLSSMALGSGSSPQLVARVSLDGLSQLIAETEPVPASLDSKYVDDDGQDDAEPTDAAASTAAS